MKSIFSLPLNSIKSINSVSIGNIKRFCLSDIPEPTAPAGLIVFYTGG